MRLIKLIFLLAVPCAVYAYWPNILINLPVGEWTPWVPLLAVLLYGLLVAMLVQRSVVVETTDNRQVLKAIDEVRAKLAGLEGQAQNQPLRPDGKADMLAYLHMLETFDPEAAKKIPQLAKLMESISTFNWPTVDGNQLDQVTMTLQIAEKAKALQELLAGAESDRLVGQLHGFEGVLHTLEALQLTRDGETRDFGDLGAMTRDMGGFVKERLKLLADVLSQLDGETLTKLGERLDQVQMVALKLESLQTQDDGETRDFGALQKSGSDAAAALQGIAGKLELSPAELEGLSVNIKWMGKLARDIETAVLDDEGDVKDFSHAQQALVQLRKTVETANLTVERTPSLRSAS